MLFHSSSDHTSGAHNGRVVKFRKEPTTWWKDAMRLQAAYSLLILDDSAITLPA
jgi:hypothetical protein